MTKVGSWLLLNNMGTAVVMVSSHGKVMEKVMEKVREKSGKRSGKKS